MSDQSVFFEGLVEGMDAAQRGSSEALGRLLESCRQYLLLVANQALDPDLRCKVGASDLVQDTFLEAHRDFHQFRGKTAQELLGWLRRILLHNVANSGRRHRSPDTRFALREVPLGDIPLEGLPGERVADTESPDERILLEEEDLALEQALEMLPEQYRRAIHLRNRQGRSFAQIGEELGRTAEAARKVWARAVVQLQNILEPAHAPRQPSNPG